MCQAIAFEPGAIREAVDALYYSETHFGLVLNRALVETTLNKIAEVNAPAGHEYEVAWCLWAALSWQLQISAVAASAISQLENSVIAILALDALHAGLFAAGGLDTRSWESRMTTDELYEEQWLLAYEANVQGWLPSVAMADHVAADPNFQFLKAQNVRFYTPTAIPIVRGALAYP